MNLGTLIKSSILFLVCLCMSLYNPMGIKAEVNTVIEQWYIEATNDDGNTNQTQPNGQIQCEFSEYKKTDPDTEELREGFALTLRVPKGTYRITPEMMKTISEKALKKDKKIYSMTIEGEEGAQISGLDFLPKQSAKSSNKNNYQYLNNLEGVSQFALIEVDFKVPIVEMNGLFEGNSTLEVVHNLEVSKDAKKVLGLFANTPKLKSLPNVLSFPCDITAILSNSGIKSLENMTIEATGASGFLAYSNVTKISNCKIKVKDAISLFSSSKLEEIDNLVITTSRARWAAHFVETLKSVKNMTLNIELDEYTPESFNMSGMFERCINLVELDLTLNANDNLKKLNMCEAFQQTGLSSTPKIQIPESVEELDMSLMFNACWNLESIPETFKIPKKAVKSCNVDGMFAFTPKLTTFPENFVMPIGRWTYLGCNSLKKLPEGFQIGNLDTEKELEELLKNISGYGGFGLCKYPDNWSGDRYPELNNDELPRIALPLKVHPSLKLYQQVGDVIFTQKIFFAGLPSDMQVQEEVLDVGASYVNNKEDNEDSLKTKLKKIKSDLESKGYTDINFILKPYEKVSNPIADNYAKFRSLSIRNVGALDSVSNGKTLDDFIAELKKQQMDCDPKIIEVKYSGGVVASTPKLTVMPVYTDDTNKQYDQKEWTKDNVNGIAKIIITDPNGNSTDVLNEDLSNGNEFTYAHQILVTGRPSGEPSYTYQAVNKQGSLSERESVTIKVDVDKPIVEIENGILKARDNHSGVKKLKLPDEKNVSWTDDYTMNGYVLTGAGIYTIYDYVGNKKSIVHGETVVTEPAITLSYEKDWTNKDVMVEVTITNADEAALLQFPDGTTKTVDKSPFRTSYLVKEEGEKDYRFVVKKKTREEGELTEIAHIKLDKTKPTSNIVAVNSKNYLKASDVLSGVSHLISPSGKTIMWLPEYEQNGYQIAEDGTYQVYDRAGNKTEPDKKTEDKPELELDKKSEDRKEPEISKPQKDFTNEEIPLFIPRGKMKAIHSPKTGDRIIDGIVLFVLSGTFIVTVYTKNHKKRMK